MLTKKPFVNNMFVNKKQIWNEDIVSSRGLKSFFSQKPSAIFHQVNKAVEPIKGWTPPIFLYLESRGLDNYVSGQLVYTGNGSTSTGQEFIASREIIDFYQKIDIDSGRTFEPSEYLQTKDMRGKVLDAFCKLEFCVDAFICIATGAYDENVNLKNIKKEFNGDFDGLFTSTHKKINYLFLNKLISEEAYVLLNKAKKLETP